MLSFICVVGLYSVSGDKCHFISVLVFISWLSGLENGTLSHFPDCLISNYMVLQHVLVESNQK